MSRCRILRKNPLTVAQTGGGDFNSLNIGLGTTQITDLAQQLKFVLKEEFLHGFLSLYLIWIASAQVFWAEFHLL